MQFQCGQTMAGAIDFTDSFSYPVIPRMGQVAKDNLNSLAAMPCFQDASAAQGMTSLFQASQMFGLPQVFPAVPGCTPNNYTLAVAQQQPPAGGHSLTAANLGELDNTIPTVSVNMDRKTTGSTSVSPRSRPSMHLPLLTTSNTSTSSSSEGPATPLASFWPNPTLEQPKPKAHLDPAAERCYRLDVCRHHSKRLSTLLGLPVIATPTSEDVPIRAASAPEALDWNPSEFLVTPAEEKTGDLAISESKPEPEAEPEPSLSSITPEAWSEMLVSNLSDVVLVLTTAGRIAFLSPLLIEKLGLSMGAKASQATAGLPLSIFCHEQDKPLCQQMLLDCTVHRAAETLLRIQTASGQFILLDIRAKLDSNSQYIVCSARVRSIPVLKPGVGGLRVRMSNSGILLDAFGTHYSPQDVESLRTLLESGALAGRVLLASYGTASVTVHPLPGSALLEIAPDKPALKRKRDTAPASHAHGIWSATASKLEQENARLRQILAFKQQQKAAAAAIPMFMPPPPPPQYHQQHLPIYQHVPLVPQHLLVPPSLI